ncbi:hypothetical protein PENARI_c003G12444 [Penicillium arizonense]|uniref:Uncharacterized protein n=1 Tax=Penicillium arizonense TaxID=1835702 RepID=A0A1F5LUJ3_PENAI|nr:hypothetical protein PENARI_c003G12444 [Penicillium arizonense]OGE56511.1 hypothetical protein PENARI_c003G12444 [Penicillium arizonense]
MTCGGFGNTSSNTVLSNDTTAFIYSTDKRPELDLHLAHSRRGREVSAYLSYVIDYYDDLPPYSIFIHADEKQRHNDLFGPKTSTILQNLRPEAVEAKGYLNLRYVLIMNNVVAITTDGADLWLPERF